MRVACLVHSSRIPGLAQLINCPDFSIVVCLMADNDTNFQEGELLCTRQSIPFFISPKRGEWSILKGFTYDLLLTFGYPYLINIEVINSAQYSINCHPALLPEYRGICAANYAIRFGDKEHGITIHFLDVGIDTGDIILQKRVPLTLFDTPETMRQTCKSLEVPAIIEAVRLMRSHNFMRIKQGEPKRITKTKLTPADSEIPSHLFSIELYNHLRSCDPERYPAFTVIDDRKVYIKMWWDEALS